jgi:hypothetical protein
MVFQLRIEARRPPSWLSSTHRDQHVSRLRTALGGLARDARIRWTLDSTLSLVLHYEPDGPEFRERHQVVLLTVMRACDQAGLFATSATVSRIVSHWTQGAIAGALTGLGLSRTQEDRYQPAVALGAIALGALAGAFVRRETPVYRAALLPYTGWRLIQVEPESSAARFRVGFA